MDLCFLDLKIDSCNDSIHSSAIRAYEKASFNVYGFALTSKLISFLNLPTNMSININSDQLFSLQHIFCKCKWYSWIIVLH